MADTLQQTQMRQHLSEMRRAARGLGTDFAVEFRTLDDKISRLGTATAKGLKYDVLDIEADFARLGRRIDTGLAALPQNIKRGATAAGSALAGGAVRLGGATRDAFESAGHRASEGTKNALASAAGVNRKPMKEWGTPQSSSDSASDR